jgi:outer membrane protein
MVLLAGIAGTATAQKFAYVDTEYILEQVPEYKSAQKKLDMMAEDWQKELEKQKNHIDKLRKELQAEQVLLTDELRKKKEDEIADLEKAMKEFQKQKFGYEGELFKKRQELIKPIQDKVFDAVMKVAKESALDFIFDKSSEMTMLYTNAKYDRSDDVLEEMGINVTNTNNNKK